MNKSDKYLIGTFAAGKGPTEEMRIALDLQRRTLKLKKKELQERQKRNPQGQYVQLYRLGTREHFMLQASGQIYVGYRNGAQWFALYSNVDAFIDRYSSSSYTLDRKAFELDELRPYELRELPDNCVYFKDTNGWIYVLTSDQFKRVFAGDQVGQEYLVVYFDAENFLRHYRSLPMAQWVHDPELTAILSATDYGGVTNVG